MKANEKELIICVSLELKYDIKEKERRKIQKKILKNRKKNCTYRRIFHGTFIKLSRNA